MRWLIVLVLAFIVAGDFTAAHTLPSNPAYPGFFSPVFSSVSHYPPRYVSPGYHGRVSFSYSSRISSGRQYYVTY